VVFHELTHFINHSICMSHIYQPVMLMTLLRHGGVCSEKDIAKAILEYYQSQIEYYTKVSRIAVVKGLAIRIARGDVVAPIRGKRIVELPMHEL
jgi:ATP adenylyltransferase